MRVLLLRPPSPNERFGLGPFFRVEPLGLEYVAAALLARGHAVQIADLRFAHSLRLLLRNFRPNLVGIACLHTVDIPTTLSTARAIKRLAPSTFVLVGGHAAASFPDPLLRAPVDAVALADGETVVPALAAELAAGGDGASAKGLLLRVRGTSGFEPTAAITQRVSLNAYALPARHLVRRYQHRYMCVHKSPLWAVETTRGCPYRCSFCSIWRHHGRSFRCRSIDAVCNDLASVGDNVFVVDDLFWHPRARSLELARELRRRGIRKDWVLVQSRLDTVARNHELLEAWRPFARQFDIFFGFEAPRDDQLAALSKDATASCTEAGVQVARDLDYGVTGNFVVDPDWEQADFEAMWAMVDCLRLNRSGFTVLTPLPGTPLFDALRNRIVETDWARWDMHHLLVEPKLGRRRFFELFVESWRRNVLSPRYSTQKWWRWARELGPRQMVTFAQVLLQTQRMLSVEAYMKETIAARVPASAADPQ
ncbi:MAG: B12-binding domain-containing radical SAM protein [Myxococcota bacterium]